MRPKFRAAERPAVRAQTGFAEPWCAATGYVLAAVTFLVCAQYSPAALQTDVDVPYRLRIVLDIADHPLLTAVFKERTSREIRDGLQAALGKMAVVELVDGSALEKAVTSGRRSDPSMAQSAALFTAVRAGGLEALENFREISGTKTHFVLLRFDNDEYVIHTRQFDGSTGLASPVTRHARIADRPFVARAVMLLVYKDFGMVGTATQVAAETLQVQMKASGLPAGPDADIHRNDIFAVSRIRQEKGVVVGNRIDWTLAQASEPAGQGAWRFRVFNLYQDPFAMDARTLGYRCIKLGTSPARLRVRLINEATRAPLGSLRITVSAVGFGQQVQEEGSTDSEGLYRSSQEYNPAAFVQVYSGETFRAQIPVAMVDERIVICPLNMDATTDARGQLEQRERRLLESLTDTLQEYAVLISDLNLLEEKKARDAAVEQAREFNQFLQQQVGQYNLDLASARESRKQLRLPESPVLAACEQQYRDLKSRQQELGKYLHNLEDIVRQEKDPRRARQRELINRARLLESQGEYRAAIKIYEDVLKDAGSDPSLDPARKHLAQLQEQARPKNAEHRQAQDFIYDQWPKVDSAAQLKADLPKAQKALQVCNANGDHLTPAKLLAATMAHASQLTKRLEKIESSAMPEDQSEAQTILDVNQGLAKLMGEARESVKASTGGH